MGVYIFADSLDSEVVFISTSAAGECWCVDVSGDAWAVRVTTHT